MGNYNILKNAFTKQTRYRKIEICIIFAFQFTIFLSFAILVPLKEEIMEGLSISNNQFIAATLINGFGIAIGYAIHNYLLKKAKKEVSLTVLYELLTLGTFMWPAVTSFYTILPFRLLSGIIGGVILCRSIEMIGQILGRRVLPPLRIFSFNSYKLYFILSILIGFTITNIRAPEPLLIFAFVMLAVCLTLLELRSRDKSDYNKGNVIF